MGVIVSMGEMAVVYGSNMYALLESFKLRHPPEVASAILISRFRQYFAFQTVLAVSKELYSCQHPLQLIENNV